MAFSNTRTFGVEIEVTNISPERLASEMTLAGFPCRATTYTHATTDCWKVVRDASVVSDAGTPGCELVSPVLKGDEGLKTLAAVVKLLKKLRGKVNRTCGFHVHVDGRDLGLDGFKQLAKVYGKYEEAIDGLVNLGRRGNGNTYCRSLRKGDTAGFLARIDQCRTIEEVSLEANRDGSSCSGSRYHKLNVQSYWRQSTVEFRQKEGTLDAKEAVAWVRLVVSLVQGAAERKSEYWSRKIGSQGADKADRFFSLYVADRTACAFFKAQAAS